MSLLNKKAPDFKLQNGNFEFISLEELRKKGNVVILFYPLAFSSVCTEELCSIRDNMKIYNSLNATVVGISVDSLFVQKAFKQAQNLNFELLSDFNKKASLDFGVLYEDFYGMKGVSKRSAFIVDKDGIIRYEEIHDKDDVIPDFLKMQGILANL